MYIEYITYTLYICVYMYMLIFCTSCAGCTGFAKRSFQVGLPRFCDRRRQLRCPKAMRCTGFLVLFFVISSKLSLSIFLSICVSVHLFICLSVGLSVYWLFNSVCVSVYLLCLSMCLSIHPSIHPSVCPCCAKQSLVFLVRDSVLGRSCEGGAGIGLLFILPRCSEGGWKGLEF